MHKYIDRWIDIVEQEGGEGRDVFWAVGKRDVHKTHLPTYGCMAPTLTDSPDRRVQENGRPGAVAAVCRCRCSYSLHLFNPSTYNISSIYEYIHRCMYDDRGVAMVMVVIGRERGRSGRGEGRGRGIHCSNK